MKEQSSLTSLCKDCTTEESAKRGARKVGPCTLGARPLYSSTSNSVRSPGRIGLCWNSRRQYAFPGCSDCTAGAENCEAKEEEPSSNLWADEAVDLSGSARAAQECRPIAWAALWVASSPTSSSLMALRTALCFWNFKFRRLILSNRGFPREFQTPEHLPVVSTVVALIPSIAFLGPPTFPSVGAAMSATVVARRILPRPLRKISAMVRAALAASIVAIRTFTASIVTIRTLATAGNCRTMVVAPVPFDAVVATVVRNVFNGSAAKQVSTSSIAADASVKIIFTKGLFDEASPTHTRTGLIEQTHTVHMISRGLFCNFSANGDRRQSLGDCYHSKTISKTLREIVSHRRETEVDLG
ncbi:unnamed protein product [Nesidiocoris tenuis]|uniref:Uncharacterized protein n=1 Tax=Nesidiocoris tenuis TaxID=355587 RepID=A0A6H5HCL3_9HEMI|nr:unnamed protein product [Nesidiocoris tenuis]